MTREPTTIWASWRAIGHKIADVQARVLLTVFYFAVVGPFAIGLKAFSDPLRLNPSRPGSWIDRPGSDEAPASRAKKQF